MNRIHYQRYDENQSYDRWLGRFKHKVMLEVRDQMRQGGVDLGVYCHNYYRVDVGQVCCECGEKVVSQWSGIACPCGHRWFCW